MTAIRVVRERIDARLTAWLFANNPIAEGPIPGEPPAARSAGGRGTRRGFGDVVVRALDPRVRSAMIEEEGVRRIVINSRYPLYACARATSGISWRPLCARCA